MNQLSKEVIEAIEEIVEKYYPIDLGYDNVITTLDSTQNEEMRNCCLWGFKEAITKPEIYEKAGLISLEDAMFFSEWAQYECIRPEGDWILEKQLYTTAQLFQIYQDTKNK